VSNTPPAGEGKFMSSTELTARKRSPKLSKAFALSNIKKFVSAHPRLRSATAMARMAVQSASGPVLHCPLCGEDHRFLVTGVPPRPNAVCPACDSLERHRLLSLYLAQYPELVSGKAVLHFAPEQAIKRLIENLSPRNYVTADLQPERGDIILSIEDIKMPDSFDLIIVSHILEHVDDRAALRELYAAVKPGGVAIIMVPIVEGWAETYENERVTTETERLRHFGQEDHVRLYGRDLRERIRDAGFVLEEFTASPAECLSMGLKPGETVFVARKTHH
jgi:SAM-dependent methyltransferase